MLELNRVYNIDCMAGMAEFPDGYFDITVVDPPYGGAGFAFSGKGGTRFCGRFDRYAKTDTSPADTIITTQTVGGGIALHEPAADGRRNTAKKL